jgi:hypothetical protein
MWCAELAHLAEVLLKLNILNTSMRGEKQNLIMPSDKMIAFSAELPESRSSAKGNSSGFPLLDDVACQLKLKVNHHLQR